MTEGRVIHGRYRLLSKLGQGGMGSVWRGIHIELGTPVAVKLIDPNVAGSPVALRRFKREAQAAASLRGSNVVQLLDYGIDEAVPYIVMELLEGESLTSRLSRMAPLSPRETSRILMQVGKALARAHALNIVHRDLKPDNIFIVRDGDDEITKVLDFGIAKTMSPEAFEASIQTKSGAILGTPHYMSPEQAAGRSSVDHRSDIWSLGVIAFECLTGCRPFNGATLGGLVLAICAEPIPLPSEVGSVPRGINEWFSRCVCREQAGRFQTITEAINALRIICDPPSVSTPPEPLWEQSGHASTLQYPREVTLRAPDSRIPSSQVAGPVEQETLSSASRTLGLIHGRRPTIAYAALLSLLGIGIAGLVFFVKQTDSARATATDASTSAAAEAGSSLPLLVARELESAQPVGSTLVTSAAPEASSQPPLRPAPPSRTRFPLPSSAAATAAVASSTPVASAAAAPSGRGASDASPVAPQGGPATRPDSPTADSPMTRKNVEDRLAF